MKRLNAPPPGVAAERGTQVTALKVFPASVGGPLSAPAAVPAVSNAVDVIVATKSVQAIAIAGFADLSIRVVPLTRLRDRPSPRLRVVWHNAIDRTLCTMTGSDSL
jgi:hypothetical protein